MKLSRKLGLAVLPLAVILAGCQTTSGSAQQQAAEAEQTAQRFAIEVYEGQNTAAPGFRAIQLNETQVIYVGAAPIVTSRDVTAATPVVDQDGNPYVALGLTAAGIEALSRVPETSGFVTLYNGQLASLQGLRQDNMFIFRNGSSEESHAIAGDQNTVLATQAAH